MKVHWVLLVTVGWLLSLHVPGGETRELIPSRMLGWLYYRVFVACNNAFLPASCDSLVGEWL